MAYQTYMKFPQQIDVHNLSEKSSAAGQVVKTYFFSETIKAFMTPGSNDRDVSPYIKDVDQYHIHVPKHFDGVVTYKSRLLNIRDNRGNVIEAGPLEVVSIMKYTGISGGVHHLIINAKVVVEVQ
jgi:D-hexose-6-phosphate mutarotase